MDTELEIVTALLVLLLIWEVARLFLSKSADNAPPGPLPLPFIGNLHNLGSKPNLSLTELGKKYGGVFQIYLGRQRVVIINDADTAKEALVKKAADFAGRPNNLFGAYLDHGGYSYGFGDYTPVWKLQRKMAHEAIKQIMRNIEQTVSLELDQIMPVFEGMKSGKPQDPRKAIELFVLNVICAAVFGSRYELEDPEFLKIVEANDILFAAMGAGNFANVFSFFLKFLPSRNVDRLKKAALDRGQIIIRKYLEHVETFDERKIRDFTDALLNTNIEMQKKRVPAMKLLEEEHIRRTIIDVFVGGIETTAATLHWAFLYLVRFPKEQEKIHKELDEVVGKHRLPELTDRKQLSHLEAFIAETLRLSSVVALSLPHKTTADTSLQGYSIPKDTTVWLNLWAIHHDSHQWSEPFKFDPSRFLDENANFLAPYSLSLFTFSAGKRICPGSSMARIVMFLFLSRLLHRFELRCPQEGELPTLDHLFGIVLHPKPFEVTICKR